jgi:hypothetical protein
MMRAILACLTMTTAMLGQAEMPGMSHPMMMSSFAGIPTSRESSGTGWQPDATPMYGHHEMPGDWMVMTHFNAFIGYDHQSGARGDDQFNSINWLMIMADHGTATDKLSLRGMFSLEPWTVTTRGYPLLFQTGEAYQGRPLFDRQHPHDFFMELAAIYRHAVAADGAAFLYVAPSGEPALGPPAFMHRTSAMDNPAAPISHHWMDSTHISFGVATLGYAQGRWQVEGSAFNGREPDEHRWNLERPKLDSYSGRLSFNPSENWSLQVSHGYLASPEILHPEEAHHRSTASVQHYLPLAGDGGIATTLSWGVNRVAGRNSSAVMAETSWKTGGSVTIFGRGEYVEKTGEELALTPSDEKFPVEQVTVGASYNLTPKAKVAVSVGGTLTYTFKPQRLDAIYGDHPTGAWLFVRLSSGERM